MPPRQPATARKPDFSLEDKAGGTVCGIDEAGRERAAANRTMLEQKGVIAVDMETSALLAAANALGVACATLCLGTVNALTQEKIEPVKLARGERHLFEIALSGLCALD